METEAGGGDACGPRFKSRRLWQQRSAAQRQAFLARCHLSKVSNLNGFSPCYETNQALYCASN